MILDEKHQPSDKHAQDNQTKIQIDGNFERKQTLESSINSQVRRPRKLPPLNVNQPEMTSQHEGHRRSGNQSKHDRQMGGDRHRSSTPRNDNSYGFEGNTLTDDYYPRY